MFRFAFVILLVCCLMGGVVHATESANSEVQIAIESAQTAEELREMRSVHTGDGQTIILYAIMLCVALFLIRYVIKIKKRSLWLPGVILLFSLVPQTSHAAETSNVAVTVPTNLSVIFESDGTTSVSEFTVSNQTLLPLFVKKIHVVEKNDWKLCTSDSEIPVDTKQIELKIEKIPIGEEENLVNIPIGYNTSRNLDIQVRRGAWTSRHAPEEAFQLELAYEFGTREFALSFDSNGSGEVYGERMVTNGTIAELPTPFRAGYEFTGWADSTGRLYKNQYTMPVGNECLKASWREVSGFVLYLQDDQTLRFVYLNAPLSVGDLYDGIPVTAIYPILKNSVYTSAAQVPWYDSNTYKTTAVKKVIVEDVIQPTSTAFWFYNMRDCERFELENLDTSKVVNMTNMFAYAAYNASKLQITGISGFDVRQVTTMQGMFKYMGYNVSSIQFNIQEWNTYKVTDMSYMFAYMGYNSSGISLGYLAKWTVQSVTNMNSMFYMTGYRANWKLVIGAWEVSSTTSHVNFNYGVSGKVLGPW